VCANPMSRQSCWGQNHLVEKSANQRSGPLSSSETGFWEVLGCDPSYVRNWKKVQVRPSPVFYLPNKLQGQDSEEALVGVEPHFS
jgi:hypothetical protein